MNCNLLLPAHRRVEAGSETGATLTHSSAAVLHPGTVREWHTLSSLSTAAPRSATVMHCCSHTTTLRGREPSVLQRTQTLMYFMHNGYTVYMLRFIKTDPLWPIKSKDVVVVVVVSLRFFLESELKMSPHFSFNLLQNSSIYCWFKLAETL